MTKVFGSIVGGARIAAMCACLCSVGGAVLASEANPKDLYEGFNRSMFAVNEALDKYAVRPVAQAYDVAVPLPAKAGVGNFFSNAGDLWIGANNALQGTFGDAGIDLARLLVNSTVGIFGLFDVASELGLEHHDEDFGQSMAVWGVRDGGYVFLPILGPRTLRDAGGWVVDRAGDPVAYVRPVGLRAGSQALRLVDIRASLLPSDRLVEEAALDKYAYIRDAYLQRRRNLIHDGRPPRIED